jgi:predicted PurR-regulated permease PerM
LIGGEVAGVIGLIVAVPVFAVLKVTLTHLTAHFIKH